MLSAQLGVSDTPTKVEQRGFTWRSSTQKELRAAGLGPGLADDEMLVESGAHRDEELESCLCRHVDRVDAPGREQGDIAKVEMIRWNQDGRELLVDRAGGDIATNEEPERIGALRIL